MLHYSLLAILPFIFFVVLIESFKECETGSELILDNGLSKAVQGSQAVSANVPLTPGVWTNFEFGNVGINSSSVFNYTALTSGVFLISDLYWAGDSFALYMNESYVGSTCLVNASTTNYTTNPHLAFNLTPVVWSYHCFAVIPGLTTYTISPNQSPYTGGVGAVMILFNGTTCPASPNC